MSQAVESGSVADPMEAAEQLEARQMAQLGERFIEKSWLFKLADGGEIHMAFEPTFWGAGFGTLRDRFGTRWMVNCDEPPAEP